MQYICTWWILIGEGICYGNIIQKKWYDLIMIMQNTGTVYTNTYRLESIYNWYMQYYFQILTKQINVLI